MKSKKQSEMDRIHWISGPFAGSTGHCGHCFLYALPQYFGNWQGIHQDILDGYYHTDQCEYRCICSDVFADVCYEFRAAQKYKML